MASGATSIVTLALALGAVRADAGVEDELCEVLLAAAEQAAIDYLNRPVYGAFDEFEADIEAGTAGENAMVANAAIKAAVLKMFADLFTNRGITAVGTVSELPFNAKALLRPWRIIPGV